MKNSIFLLLPLLYVPCAQAGAPRLLDAFQTTFQGSQPGLVEVYDAGASYRLQLRVSIGGKKFTYDDIVVTGQSVERDESGFTITEHDHNETERSYSDERKTLHVDLIGGALVVTKEEEESSVEHQVAEADSDTGHEINYVTGELSYYRLGRSEDGTKVPSARLPKNCAPPKLETYKNFTGPACAWESMK